MSKQQQKLLLLGGLYYLIPIIKAAHELGVYVITCDYLPNNIAHKFSDEYHNVSIIDREAVLRLAKELDVDGIMSFAVDPGVMTAAYVAEKLNLPSVGSYEAVAILQNKDKFREFLRNNCFNVPYYNSYSCYNEVLEDIHNFKFPIIIKPTDSAGSKGVTKVESQQELEDAVQCALENSFKHRIIIEEFIEKRGCSSDCDSFSVNGQMVLTTFNAQYFDSKALNPFTPSAFSWPTTFTESEQTELKKEIQRLVTLLNLGTSIYNIESRIGVNGKPYIMEMSPRGGGNRLAEMERLISGNDLIKASICGSLGLPIDEFNESHPEGYWAELVVHYNSDTSCEFIGVVINDKYKPYLKSMDMYVCKGDLIRPFKGANNAIGTIIMNFQDANMLKHAIESQENWISVLGIIHKQKMAKEEVFNYLTTMNSQFEPNLSLQIDDMSSYSLKLSSNARFITSTYNKALIAYYVNNTNNTAYIPLIWVDIDIQSKGVASQMLDYLHKILKAEGYKTVSLEVFTNNVKAKNLYIRKGYKMVEDRGNKLMMTKELIYE